MRKLNTVFECGLEKQKNLSKTNSESQLSTIRTIKSYFLPPPFCHVDEVLVLSNPKLDCQWKYR